MGNSRNYTTRFIKVHKALGMEVTDVGTLAKPKRKTKKKTEEKIKKEELFLYLKSFFPDVISEYKFLEDRKFQFDFYIPSKKCGVEYEGLFSSISRHTSIVGYNNDCEKYTLASLNGYKLIRVTAITPLNNLKLYLEKLLF